MDRSILQNNKKILYMINRNTFTELYSWLNFVSETVEWTWPAVYLNEG